MRLPCLINRVIAVREREQGLFTCWESRSKIKQSAVFKQNTVWQRFRRPPPQFDSHDDFSHPKPEMLVERGKNRIHNKTYFQQHAGPRMTHKAMKVNSSHANRARVERALAGSYSLRLLNERCYEVFELQFWGEGHWRGAPCGSSVNLLRWAA